MRIRPAVCFSLGCEKSVDHDGLELACSASIQPSGFAANDCRSGIDCGADCIGKNDFAAVWNPFWIDGAMSGAQTWARTKRPLEVIGEDVMEEIKRRDVAGSPRILVA